MVQSLNSAEQKNNKYHHTTRRIPITSGIVLQRPPQLLRPLERVEQDGERRPLFRCPGQIFHRRLRNHLSHRYRPKPREREHTRQEEASSVTGPRRQPPQDSQGPRPAPRLPNLSHGSLILATPPAEAWPAGIASIVRQRRLRQC